MTKPDARAMAALWMKRGEASDLIASIKKDAEDPRNSETAKAEALIAELSGCIDARDFSGAIPIIGQLDRQLFKLKGNGGSARPGNGTHAADLISARPQRG